MNRITHTARLNEILSLPLPSATLDEGFGRTPNVRCHLAACTLDDICHDLLSPRSMRWTDGVVTVDPAAAARARIVRCVRSEAGEAVFDDAAARALPAGVVDRLLFAIDQANGYRELAEALPAGASVAVYRRPAACWVAGLLPQAPEQALCVRPYDFAALAASEEAATIGLPGGEVRLDLLAVPVIVAASLACGPEPEAPTLVDEATARRLPCGAARAIVELADRLSEMGGPPPAVRFQRPADPAKPLAAPPHGPLPERAARPAGRGAAAPCRRLPGSPG